MIAYSGNILLQSGDMLYLLSPEAQQTIATKALPDASPVSFTLFFDGVNPAVFYASESVTGYLKGGIFYPWESGDYTGPTTTKALSGPPKSYNISYGAGRMWCASGNAIYGSLAFNPFLFDFSSMYFPFKSRINIIAPLDDGIWISDCDYIYWLSTRNWELKRVATFPAFFGVPSLVDAGTLPFDQIFGLGYLVPTAKGICYLGDGGIFVNLTEKTVELRKLYGFPYDIHSFSGIVDKNRYIISLWGNDSIGLIMNLCNLAVTQHNIYCGTGMVKAQDKIYILGDTALQEIKQPGDVSVSSQFSIMFDAGHNAHIRKLYIKGEFEDAFTATLTSDQNVEKAYAVIPRLLANKSHRFKIPIAKINSIGEYWTVKIASTYDYSVDEISVMPVNRELLV